MRYDIWNLGSSSEGNCFIVKHKDCKEALMLECGLPYGQIAARTPQNMPIRSVLISHEHQDHSQCWRKLRNNAFCVCASVGTADALNDYEGLILKLKEREWQGLSRYQTTYEVFPLRANHDAAVPFMYLIRAPKTEDILLFAIDTAGIPYDFSQFNITDILIECNFMEDLISEDVNFLHVERVRRSHMSLDALCEFFRNQKSLKNLEQITLCHLSQSNCDPKKAKETIMAATGIPVRVCAAKGGFIGN